jgi:hypothetical protein
MCKSYLDSSFATNPLSGTAKISLLTEALDGELVAIQSSRHGLVALHYAHKISAIRGMHVLTFAPGWRSPSERCLCPLHMHLHVISSRTSIYRRV